MKLVVYVPVAVVVRPIWYAIPPFESWTMTLTSKPAPGVELVVSVNVPLMVTCAPCTYFVLALFGETFKL